MRSRSTGASRRAGASGSRRTAFGPTAATVNLTARLQALAGGGEIIVSDAVLARAGAELRVGPAQAVQVKGFAAPVTVHRLLGVEPGATASDAPAREAAAPREGPRRPSRGIWRGRRAPRVRAIPGGTRPAGSAAEDYTGLSV